MAAGLLDRLRAVALLGLLVGIWLLCAEHDLARAAEGAALTRVSGREANSRALVFVHGVIGDPASTWTNKNGSYWPALVGTDFPSIDIFVFGYYTPARASAPTIVELANQLTLTLQAADVLPTRYNGKYEKLYFVAHSMGNLIVRQALQRRADYRYVDVPVIVSLASPSQGAQVATIAQNFSKNPTLASMAAGQFNDFLRSLNESWLDEHPRTEVACAYETLPWGRFGLIVPRESATAVCTRTPPLPVTADHAGVVKPGGLRTEQHDWLKLQLSAPRKIRDKPRIILMDHPVLAYDETRLRTQGVMNANVIQEVLRRARLDGTVAPVHNKWNEGDTANVVAQDPDLLVVHYSAFSGIPRNANDFEFVLTHFLRDVMTGTKARVILYTRWPERERGPFAEFYQREFWSRHSGLPAPEIARAWSRLSFLDVRAIDPVPEPRLDDRPVAEALVRMVRSALD